LPEIANIYNGKRFVDTDGKHIGGTKKSQTVKKEQRKRKWIKRKLDLTKTEIAFPFPSVGQ
jgi:hypothetical protein